MSKKSRIVAAIVAALVIIGGIVGYGVSSANAAAEELQRQCQAAEEARTAAQMRSDTAKQAGDAAMVLAAATARYPLSTNYAALAQQVTTDTTAVVKADVPAGCTSLDDASSIRDRSATLAGKATALIASAKALTDDISAFTVAEEARIAAEKKAAEEAAAKAAAEAEAKRVADEQAAAAAAAAAQNKSTGSGSSGSTGSSSTGSTKPKSSGSGSSGGSGSGSSSSGGGSSSGGSGSTSGSTGGGFKPPTISSSCTEGAIIKIPSQTSSVISTYKCVNGSLVKIG